MKKPMTSNLDEAIKNVSGDDCSDFGSESVDDTEDDDSDENTDSEEKDESEVDENEDIILRNRYYHTIDNNDFQKTDECASCRTSRSSLSKSDISDYFNTRKGWIAFCKKCEPRVGSQDSTYDKVSDYIVGGTRCYRCKSHIDNTFHSCGYVNICRKCVQFDNCICPACKELPETVTNVIKKMRDRWTIHVKRNSFQFSSGCYQHWFERENNDIEKNCMSTIMDSNEHICLCAIEGFFCYVENIKNMFNQNSIDPFDDIIGSFYSLIRNRFFCPLNVFYIPIVLDDTDICRYLETIDFKEKKNIVCIGKKDGIWYFVAISIKKNETTFDNIVIKNSTSSKEDVHAFTEHVIMNGITRFEEGVRESCQERGIQYRYSFPRPFIHRDFPIELGNIETWKKTDMGFATVFLANVYGRGKLENDYPYFSLDRMKELMLFSFITMDCDYGHYPDIEKEFSRDIPETWERHMIDKW